MTLYLIKKGWHYSIKKLSLLGLPIKLELVKYRPRVNFIFGGGVNQVADQINKLFGFTLGWFVHKNSIRVGWQWNKDFEKIDLFAYYYIDGNRRWVYLCSVRQYEEHELIMRVVNKNEVQVLINDRNSFLIGGTTIVYRHFKTLPSIKWKLFPYFGGKEKAKQDIRIYLHER